MRLPPRLPAPPRLAALLVAAALAPAPALAQGAAAPAPTAQAPVQAPPPASVPPGAAAVPLLSHRAAYRLSLDSTRGDVARVEGAMLYEQVDACEGWTTRQRLQMALTDRDGQTVETASDYATFEAKDGRRLRFSLTQTSQGAVSQRVAGEATLAADGTGTVRYAEPEAREEALPPGTLLPMIHTVRALEAAKAGRRLLVAPLLDGTDPDGAQDTTTALTAWQAPRAVERFPLLSPLGSARMRVAFFERAPRPGAREPAKESAGSGAPEYEVGLRYWENGVADEMKMDFGGFVVDGRMAELAEVPGGC